MKSIVSWNVNGINAAIKKGLIDFVKVENADIICFQETKVSEKTIDKQLETIKNSGYYQYWNTAERNGYSGVMVFTKLKPLSVSEGIGHPDYDKEGRLLTLEFSEFYLINAYIPNAGRDLKRLDFKLQYNTLLMEYLQKLRKKKHLILCGDLNVAHKPIDLANPQSNTKNAGFTVEERDSFTKFLDLGYVDTYREFEKGGGHYTWWSYRTKARERNVGWRLDYFVVNQEFFDQIKNNEILSEILGSDHCPIRLSLS